MRQPQARIHQGTLLIGGHGLTLNVQYTHVWILTFAGITEVNLRPELRWLCSIKGMYLELGRWAEF